MNLSEELVLNFDELNEAKQREVIESQIRK